MRSSCGAICTKTCPSLTAPSGPPATVLSASRTPGTARTSRSIAAITSVIAPGLAPSGAVTFISNCASSTPPGMNSCRTIR